MSYCDRLTLRADIPHHPPHVGVEGEPDNPCQYQREEDLKELVSRIKEESYVLFWCEVLRDMVAFHRDDVDLTTI